MLFTRSNTIHSRHLPLLLVFFLTLNANCIYGQDSFIITGQLQNRYFIDSIIQKLPDPDGSLSFIDISSPSYNTQFKRNTGISKGIKYYWVRFTVINKLNEQIDWHLHIMPKQYNEVYRVTDSEAEFLAQNGEYVRSSLSCFPENPSVIPIKLPAERAITFYIRMNTELYQEFKPIMEISLRPANTEMEAYTRNWVILAVLVGVLCSMGFYIFFQFILFRDKSFIYFFLAFFSMALYFVTFERVGYAITGCDYITRYTGNYLALMCTFFYIGFSRYFLDPEKKFPQWHTLLRRLQIFYIVPLSLIVVINLGYFWNFTPFIHTIHIITFIFLLTFAIKTYIKGHYLAGYYLWANFVFFIFLCLFVLYVIIKPTSESFSTYFLASSLKIGSFGQVFLFTLALANRFGQLNRKVVENQLEKERIEKEQILKIQAIITNINQELERKVEERTTEISHQKEELQAQAENIEIAYQEISQQKKIIERSHSQITDSLFYASLIQKAVLPSKEALGNLFKDSFVVFWPRDIVSGDFYWYTEINNIKLLAVADCTGHGVPGAFMSMLGISLLNEVVKREQITQPDKILKVLKENLINALQQEDEANEVRDGMVVGICAIYQSKTDIINNTSTLEFAGSQTPCYIVKRNDATNLPLDILETALENSTYSLHMLKADNTPIAKHFKDSTFTLKVVTLEPNDMVYLTTDGIIDQLGGPNYKKFSSKHFQDLIFKHHHLDAVQQIDYIEKELLDWMNHPEPISGSPNDQIDDICVVGFRIE